MASVIRRFAAKSKFLQPILRAITAKEVFLFIVLLGILPAIEDLSIFWLDRVAHLEFFIGDPAPLTWIVRVVPFLLLPVAGVLIYRFKNPWYLIGLLPSLLAICLAIANMFGEFDEYALSAAALSLSAKVGLLFFIVLGHIRSPSFAFFTIVALALVPIHHAVMFVMVSCIGRFIYLAASQNLKMFREIRKLRLGVLLAKSFLIWSPILLLSVPHFYLSDKLGQLAENLIYDNTFIKRQEVYTELTLDELIYEYSSERSGVVKRTLERLGYPSDGHEQIQQHLWEALVYIKPRLDKGDFKDYREPAARFREAFLLLEKGQRPVPENRKFMLEAISRIVDKIAIRRKFWGKSEVALDIELSVYNSLVKKQHEVTKALNESRETLNEKVDEQLGSIDKKVDEIQSQFRLFTKGIQGQAEKGGDAFKGAVNQYSENTKADLEERFTQCQKSIQEEIDKIPKQTMKTFALMVKPRLTDLNPGFEHDPDCGIDPACHAANMIKGLLRTAYRDQRAHALGVLKRKSEELRDAATEKLEQVVRDSQAAANAMINDVTEDLNRLAGASVQTVKDGAAAVNEKVQRATEEGAELTKKTLHGIEQPIADLNRSIQGHIDEGVETVNTGVTKVVVAVNYWILFADLTAFLGFVFVIVVSYLYVFSRVAFSEKDDLFVTLREDKREYPNGTLRQWGSVYTIPADHTEVFFVSRRFEPTGRAPKIAIPQWPTSLFARLVKRCYFMNEIAVRENQRDSVDFRSVAGAEFLEWTLADGEEVVFSYDNFVAMSDSVQLSTCISLRFTSLLMGRPFFYIAKGPGVLVLITKGVPITNEEERLVQSVSADRVIAYQKDALFSVDSELNLTDIYFSSLYLRRSSDSLIVIDADPGSAKVKTGMLRFIVKFIFPV